MRTPLMLILSFLWIGSIAQAQTFSLTNLQERAKSHDGHSTAFLQVNDEIFDDPAMQPGSKLQIHAPDGELVSFQVLSVRQFVPGYHSVIARNIEDADQLMSVTVREGNIYGIWHRHFEGDVYLGVDQNSKRSYASDHAVGRDDVLACGVGEHPGEEEKAAVLQAKSLRSSAAPLLSTALDDSITIDLMLVYTDSAAAWSNNSEFGDINGVVAQAMNLSQATLLNSDLEIELRLVNLTRVDYDEVNDGLESEESPSGVRLSRFTETNDGFMDNIHTIRDQTGADIVAWILKIDDTGGLGWRLGNAGGSPSIGFNLNRVQQVAYGYTLIHEIGHNMGNAHSRTQQSAEATEGGGLFHYSVGYQNSIGGFHTVMAYSDGLDQAPLFSSPDLSFNGAIMGTNNARTPENNARSMSLIKRAIANYRPTIVDPPVADPLVDIVNIEMNREETLSIPFQISNTGDSPLTWDLDFLPVGGLKTRAKRQAGSQEMKAVSEPLNRKQPVNSSTIGVDMKAKEASPEILYSTSFEQNQGFSLGGYQGINEWRVTSGDANINVTGANPATGSQHIRLEHEAGSSTQFVSTPFLGYQMLGSYEIRASFSVSSTQETFDFYLRDSKTGSFTAGVIISGGTIFFADLDEVNELRFFGSSFTIQADTYYDMIIVMNPDAGQIEYYLNGQLVTTNSYVGGTAPGVLQILHRNEVPGTHMDVDDIQILKISSPYPWLTIDDPTGVVFEGGSESAQLQFSSVGVAAGRYRTNMTISTNDPNQATITVPVTLTIADQVSSEEDDEPQAIALEQNYPNPFNPSTSIRFSLNQAQPVQLDVFSIDGRKVATLIDGTRSQGSHTVQFDASNLSSGIYLYQLTTPTQILTRQMVLIK